jgi:hypothetical protein
VHENEDLQRFEEIKDLEKASKPPSRLSKSKRVYSSLNLLAE